MLSLHSSDEGTDMVGLSLAQDQQAFNCHWIEHILSLWCLIKYYKVAFNILETAMSEQKLNLTQK